ncbi:MAG: pirin family protein [bacterium]|nr:pirin family protein [bacterium]
MQDERKLPRKPARRIEKLLKSQPTIEGAGVHLKRVFGRGELPDFDPFLLFDDFHSDKPEEYLKGFPWHPHRGIETITYVLHGDVEHGDSMGNQGVIGSGDVQWMTAGSGIIHQEMPKGDEQQRMWGFQLWANLPASQKMMDPKYRDVKKKDIPVVGLDNGTLVKIICGAVNNKRGPVEDIVIDPEYLDVTVPRNADFVHPTKRGYKVFAYAIAGQGHFDFELGPQVTGVEGSAASPSTTGRLVGPETLVLFGDGEVVHVSAGSQGVRFLLVSGKPLNEPVAWNGPIVMNTKEELRVAFEEYENGTFIKKT